MFNRKIEETIFMAIVSKIIILYLSGLFNNLTIGFYTIILCNIIILIYNIYFVFKTRKFIKKNILTVGLVIFILTSLLFIFSNQFRLVSVWDEFSHWALVAKNMFYLNEFGIRENSTVMFKTYLSGISLFQYFIMKLNGFFSEDLLYFAINLISISLIIPLFKSFKTLRFFKSISIYLIFAILLLIPTIFYSDFFQSLYIDGILGVAFSYVLYIYYLNRNEKISLFHILNLSFIFLLLIFIKHTGFVFAFLAFLIILLDNLFLKNKVELKFKTIWNNIKYVIISFLPCLILKLSWSSLLKYNTTTINFSEQNFIIGVLNLFNSTTGTYKESVIYSYINALFSLNLSKLELSFSFIIWLVICFSLSYLLIIQTKKREDNKVLKFLLSSILIGAILYAIFILLTYLTVFSEYEAVRLASYTRYINSYILGMFLTIFILLIIRYSQKTTKLTSFAVISFLIFTVLVSYQPLLNLTVFSKNKVNESIITREPYVQFQKTISECIGDSEKTYFISTNDKGLDYYTARYEATPKKINSPGTWSIGKPYNNDDIWTLTISAEEWKSELINNYDYVYLYNIDEQFISIFGELFSVKTNNIFNNQLYKIKPSEENKILNLVTECVSDNA